MTWTDPQSISPAPGVVEPTPAPPLPSFSPHRSTTGDGSVVDDTQISSLEGLRGLVGRWAGSGLNAIWTPSEQAKTESDRFLQLARTDDRMEFVALGGSIPNRGLTQPDLFMAGLRYSQDIVSNGKALHFENGVWLSVPATTDPPLGPTVARMASIPHGTTINAQGTVSVQTGPPTFPIAAITPFSIGHPGQLQSFAEQNLATSTAFRTPDPQTLGFDQQTLTDVNNRLRADAKPDVVTTTVISVNTQMPGAPDGGVSNTAFLGPNATTSAVSMTLWLQTLQGDPEPTVLQYSQTVLLDFNGLSWPHVTVGTLTRQPAAVAAQPGSA